MLAGYRRLGRIEAPGTLDGGDVLRVGRTLYVGTSSRSNRAGLEQLATLVTPSGYRVQPVDVLRRLGIRVHTVEMSETEKAE